jgi:putative Mg2+ transporter-C (MgtC) family protein
MSRWLALMFVDLDLVLRLSLATLMGGLIGLNRGLHGKPAGVRTHALVALGAALILIVAERLPGAEGAHVSDAQSRVIQGLITGIGFLGAGVILHGANENRVHGLTTAAALWMAALLGAACGAGIFGPVLVTFALLAIVLTFGGWFERVVHHWLPPGANRKPSPDP